MTLQRVHLKSYKRATLIIPAQFYADEKTMSYYPSMYGYYNDINTAIDNITIRNQNITCSVYYTFITYFLYNTSD